MHEPSAELDRLAHEAVDASLAVHRSLGPGYAEALYEEALSLELAARAIPLRRQVIIDVRYRAQIIGTHRLDLLVGEVLVVELKAVEAIAPAHVAQVLSYVHAGRFEVGLLINFGGRQLRGGIKRVVSTHRAARELETPPSRQVPAKT
jgi:GxxExxY protein